MENENCVAECCSAVCYANVYAAQPVRARVLLGGGGGGGGGGFMCVCLCVCTCEREYVCVCVFMFCVIFVCVCLVCVCVRGRLDGWGWAGGRLAGAYLGACFALVLGLTCVTSIFCICICICCMLVRL